MQVVPNQRAVEALLCMPRTDPLVTPDSRIGHCSDCGRPIQWHPSSPHSKRRICIPCAQDAGLIKPDDPVSATTAQVAAVRKAIKRDLN